MELAANRHRCRILRGKQVNTSSTIQGGRYAFQGWVGELANPIQDARDQSLTHS
jgi:hypothetical protein